MKSTVKITVIVCVFVTFIGTYVVPEGIKYKELRAVDPANPPVVIDVGNRNLNIKKFDLSDYYTQVRYIKLKYPSSAKEGNFLFDIYYKGCGMIVYGANSEFFFTNDYIVAGDASFGIHCYDRDGNFLYTIESNDYPKSYNPLDNQLTDNCDEQKGYTGGFSAIQNRCLYHLKEDNTEKICLYDLAQQKRIMTRPYNGKSFNRLLDDNTMASYVYWPTDTARNFLFTFDMKGDTLCRFPSYLPIPDTKSGYGLSPPMRDLYYYGNRLTIRQSLNDTVFRVVSPNRLIPVYVLNFGTYRVNIQTVLIEEQRDKLRTDFWKESERYILLAYKQNYAVEDEITQGKIKFFYAFYDKKSRQLFHFNEGVNAAPREFFIDSSIPDALPFILWHADIGEKQLSVVFSKKRLENMMKKKGFANLPAEQRDKLKTLQNELADNEVLIMVLQ